MFKFYLIHAYENQYGGLHGREDFCVIEAEDKDSLKEVANEMAEGVIAEWNYSGYEDEAIEEGLEEDSPEFEDFCLERMREDKAFDIYEVIDTKNLSLDELNIELNQFGVKDFVIDHCNKEALSIY